MRKAFRLTAALIFLAEALFCIPATAASSQSPVPAAAQTQLSSLIGQENSQYYARTTRTGILANNPAQDLETVFSSAGASFENDSSRWRVALRGYGYGDAVMAAARVTPVASGNRVEYRRKNLTEWYVNGPGGIEQGFTFSQRPASRHGSPLTLSLSFAGNLSASLEPGAEAIALSDSNGHVTLRYSGLTASDSAGRSLRSWIELRGNEFLLRVDDAGADYPIVVDPTVQLAKLSASDGTTGNWFGYSIAISGSTVVVGAPQASIGSNTYQGAAYVFVKPASGWANMTQTAKLTASDGAAFNYFGGAVSIDGGTIVVGAFDDYINSVPGAGAAYVYVQPAGGWTNMTETAKLTASDGIMDNFFGYSVAVSGNTIVVGEPHQEVNNVYDVGAAYVFVEPAGGWSNMTQTAKLTSNGAQGDQFGMSVAINGSTIVAGAPYKEIGTNWDQGAAYVFVEPAGGWIDMTPTAELTVSGGAANQYFGSAVATNGSAVVAGAPGANSYAGAAYVFVEPAGGWSNMTETAQLTASAGLANDLLGWSVAMSGNTIVAGASHAQIGSNTWAGALYMYVMPAGGWKNMTQSVRLVVSHGAAYQDLGGAVGISGNVVAAGAYGTSSYTGAGYVYGNSAAKKAAPALEP